MSELYLCNCIFCLENNPDGKLVVKSVYYRHRRKDQVLLEKELSDNEKEEEGNININLRSIKVSRHCNLLNCFYCFIYSMRYLINKLKGIFR